MAPSANMTLLSVNSIEEPKNGIRKHFFHNTFFIEYMSCILQHTTVFCISKVFLLFLGPFGHGATSVELESSAAFQECCCRGAGFHFSFAVEVVEAGFGLQLWETSLKVGIEPSAYQIALVVERELSEKCSDMDKSKVRQVSAVCLHLAQLLGLDPKLG